MEITTVNETEPKETAEQRAKRLLLEKRRDIVASEGRHPGVLKGEIVGDLLELFAEKLRGTPGNDDMAA